MTDDDGLIGHTEEDALHLGLRLRQLRRTRGLRLKDIANQVPCSESLVSKIERGRTTPSLRVLHRLAAVLNTNMAALLAPRDTGSVVKRAGQRPLITLQGAVNQSRIQLEQLIPYQLGLLLEANIHVVEPGAESDGSIEHEGEEIGYVLEGRLELWVSDERYELQAGDAFHFRSNLRHHYRNPDSDVSRVLWVNTPPTF